MKAFSRLPIVFTANFMLLITVIFADQFWQDLPFDQWTQKQCLSILKKSPWAATYSLTGMTGSPIVGRNSINISEFSTPEGKLFVHFRFLTARPLKAADGRLRLLANPDHISLKQEVTQFIDQPDPNVIVVQVTVDSEPKGNPLERSVDGFFRLGTLETVKDRIFLTCGKKDIELIGYKRPDEDQVGALLFFPRYDADGQPLLDGSEKSMHISIESKEFVIEQKFDPRKMFFKGSFSI